MHYIHLTLYRSPTDKRKSTPIAVNLDRIQVLEPHAENSTRIQFNLNEPALYVQESFEEVLNIIARNL